MFKRNAVNQLTERIKETNNPYIQFIIGPRQTGKTTIFTQALQEIEYPNYVVNADDVVIPTEQWLKTEWQQARNLYKKVGRRVVFVIDEVQKVANWSTTVKGLFDRDRRENNDVKPVLTGSSSLLLQKGLTESLMGRFEIIRSTHWSFEECREAFDYTLEDYLFFGGYPGAEIFRHDENRWKTYIRDAIIEPTLSRDIVEMEEIRKPALMRNLFYLSANYSGQELSYNKMLGQLQEAGSVVTISNYLDSLAKANMIATLQKFNKNEIKKRSSSPRLMVFDTSLLNACSALNKTLTFEIAEFKGHLIESAVGAHLLARSIVENFNVFWWREKNNEVDFVLSKADKIVAIEVKSGNTKNQSGMAKFLSEYPEAKRIIVGGSSSGACTIEEFLLNEVALF